MDTRSEDTETLHEDEQDLEAADWEADDGWEESEAILLKRSPAHPNNNLNPEQPRHASPQLQSQDYNRWTRRKQISIPAWLNPQSQSRKQRTATHSKHARTAVTWLLRVFLKCIAITLILLGTFQLLSILTSLYRSYHPSTTDPASSFSHPLRPSAPTSHWPTDSTADILPVHCHSHNDYWRPIPLTSAIQAGCTGVEADVWQIDDELYVGHSPASLTPDRTFRSLYVDPLKALLDRQNPNTTFHPFPDVPRSGVFDTDPEETLVLLVDFKPVDDIDSTWRYVVEHLDPLRQAGYLTYFDGEDVIRGPVTVVATGEAPFDRVIENATYRDVFFDAPLDALASLAPVIDSDSNPHSASEASSTTKTIQRYDPAKENAYLQYLQSLSTSADTDHQNASNTKMKKAKPKPTDATIYTPYNSYYASTSFYESIGLPLPFLRDNQLEKIRRQIDGAHVLGLKARYWETPGWPKGLRNYIWRALVQRGVDYLNVDDVWEAAGADWGWVKRGWLW